MATQVLDPERLASVLEPGRLASIARNIGRRTSKALRLNRLAAATPVAIGLALESVPWLPHWGYWPAEDVPIGRTIAFGAGLYYVQDAGSMLPIALLDVKAGRAGL